MKKTFKARYLVSAVLLSAAMSANAMDPSAPNGRMYGQSAPVPGHYPTPPMNPQQMQQMMAAQQQKMQEMQAMQQIEAEARKKAMENTAQQQMPKPKSCHHDKGMMSKRMQEKQAHMQRMEKSLANIEKLMGEMLNLMKSN